MATLIDLSIVALVFFSFLFLDSIIPLLGDAFVALFYLFVLSNLPGALTVLATFYVFLILFVMVMNFTPFRVENENMNAFTVDIFKSRLPLLHIGIGFGLLLVFVLLSTGAKGAIWGTPSLSTTIGLLSPVYNGMSLAAVGLLGIAENRAAVIIANIVSFVQPYKDIVGIPVAALVMGVFHSFAYAAQSLAGVLFPIIAFGIIILSIKILKEDVQANFSHYWYNILININRSLIIGVG